MKRIEKIVLSLAVSLLVCMTASAQTDGFRIITGHPDFKIKAVRCDASDSTCIFDMLVTNVGSQDVKATFNGGSGTSSKAYDDEGNMYNDEKYKLGAGNQQPNMYACGVTLPAGVPVRVRIQIEGLNPAAAMFSRIDMGVICDAWGWPFGQTHIVKFMNVPISRD